MNTPVMHELSPVQKRFMVLTHECGLEHEEALHAVGWCSGGLPGYHNFSRMEQMKKVHEFIANGLTEK